MKILNFATGLMAGIGLFFLQPSAAEPLPEIKTVVETEYITKTEYVKVNQTQPMEMITTAYTSGPESTGKRPGDKGYGITYSGLEAKHGICAVDKEVIPLGTSMYVEDYGYCLAADIGGAVRGLHIDVWMEHVSDARKFGREKRKVWILSNYGEEMN